MAEIKDTMFGLLRRTGPASAELLDAETGNVYGLNFAAFAAMQVAGMQKRPRNHRRPFSAARQPLQHY